MQLTSVFSFALLSTLSIAAPFRTLSKSSPSPALTWHVSDFTAGCSPGGCVYNFHIAGVATPNTPGFNTTCSGTTGKDEYQPCRDQQIRATVKPETPPQWNVDVQHGWTKDEAEFWAVGNANTTAPAKSFKIPVSEQYGVA